MELMTLLVAVWILDIGLLSSFLWWLFKLTDDVKYLKIQLLKAEQKAEQARNDAYYARRRTDD